MDQGICKIVPPPGWFNRSYDMKVLSAEIKQFSPTKQVVTGLAGVHDVDLFEMKNMSLEKFHEVTLKDQCIDSDFEDRERRFWKSLVR